MVDYVIVGAGSAGCVLARRLSEDPACAVLLLEAGGPDRQREIRIPAAFSKLFKTGVDWDYSTARQQELDGRRIYWPRGRALGGSSSINAMMAIPGHRADYDGWADLGNDGWSFDEVAPAFGRVYETLGIEELRNPNLLTMAFVEAATQAGIPHSQSVGLTDLEGVRLTPVTQRRGRRWSAADAYLRPALRRPNLSVETGALATRVLVENGRAAGVEYLVDGEVRVARGREVMLAAGAVGSPQLLLLSGIGESGELARLRIGPVHELPGVGQNLQDHVVGGLFHQAIRPLTLLAAETLAQLARYVCGRRGLLTSNVAEAAAFIHSRPGLPAPDLELVFCPVLFTKEGLEPPPEHGFTIGVVALQPRSAGLLRLASADPLDKPLIEPRYLSDPGGEDLRVLRRGIELAREIVSMPAFAGLAGRELGPGATSVDDHLRATAHTMYHPVGTCRMGRDELAVVDPELRVRGIEGLRVADASVMPRVPRGHTNLPTMMVAERAAELLRRPKVVDVVSARR